MKNQLNQFDPVRVSKTETAIWQAYYGRHFVSLFILMVRAMRELYGLKPWPARKAAYHFALAAIDFRLTRGNENHARVTQRLTRGMALICESAGWRFDHVKAAKSEFRWWMIDRYPARYPNERQGAIAQTAAVIYNATPDGVSEYALCRAQAMRRHDEFEAGRREEDWASINALLEDSYRSLKEAVA